MNRHSIVLSLDKGGEHSIKGAMKAYRPNSPRVGFVAMAALVVMAGASSALPASAPQSETIVVAQAEESGELKPRYTPIPEEPKGWYNSSYIFGMTSTVAHSTMVPAAKVPLFFLTVPLDIVFLPFAAIGGLFG